MTETASNTDRAGEAEPAGFTLPVITHRPWRGRRSRRKMAQVEVRRRRRSQALHSHRLHHVGIVVRDVGASVAWYAQHLGFEKFTEYSFPGARVAFVGPGDLRLEFFQMEGSAPMATERALPPSNLKIGGINHFAIAVDDLD